VAFAAYKFAVLAGLTFLMRQPREGAISRTLLLLRVFSLGRRSESLFDQIARVWLRAGSINLIAGPDLVTATVEPHEFLDFLGGRLSRQFVSDEASLAERISHMDTEPDPDGRYRVNEFFCRADTWQITMQRLARGSDAVLMDLRSFSKSNQGCIYELQQLLNIIPLDRLTLIIENSTDRAFLDETLQTLWQQIDPASPNATGKGAVLQVLMVREQSRVERERVLPLLFMGQRVNDGTGTIAAK